MAENTSKGRVTNCSHTDKAMQHQKGKWHKTVWILRVNSINQVKKKILIKKGIQTYQSTPSKKKKKKGVNIVWAPRCLKDNTATCLKIQLTLSFFNLIY